MECISKLFPCCCDKDVPTFKITSTCCSSKSESFEIHLDPGDKEGLERIQKLIDELRKNSNKKKR